jgi:aryl-alcohol dehydrogenase-like predicted oxidoreductase
MRYVEVGGAKLSVIGLGTWQFGSREWGYGGEYQDKTAREITLRALDLGINLIDTAEAYGIGRSERVIGKTLEDAGRRNEAFIATKIFPVMPLAPIVERRAKSSAKRLRTSVLDLYQVHWPNPVVNDQYAMAGLRRVVDAGLVRYAGVSNYPLERWQRAEESFGGPILSNQVSFSLVERRPLANLVPFAQQEGRVIIAYSPLAQGVLGGRYDAQTRPVGIARRMNPLFLPENLERAAPLIDALREIAKSHQVRPAQIALAWLIRMPNVVAIPGASGVEQVEFNAAAAEVSLTDSEASQLLDAAERFEPVAGVERARGLAESLVGTVRERLGLGDRG